MTTSRILRLLATLAAAGAVMGVLVGVTRDYRIEHAQEGWTD